MGCPCRAASCFLLFTNHDPGKCGTSQLHREIRKLEAIIERDLAFQMACHSPAKRDRRDKESHRFPWMPYPPKGFLYCLLWAVGFTHLPCELVPQGTLIFLRESCGYLRPVQGSSWSPQVAHWDSEERPWVPPPSNIRVSSV